MGKLKVGIIGCGGIANQKHFPALKNNADLAEMVAFCDIIEERATKAAEEYGVEGAKVYTDYRELLADPEIDIVHICTPNVSHSKIAVDAFAAKKNVYCEKPMSHNPEEAQKMVDAWKESGMKFTIGYQNRFRPEVQNLHASCEKGELGEIYYGKAHAVRRRAVPTWGVFPNKALQGGGPLIDIGTHALDLTLWVMNNYKPKYCVGTAYHKLNNLAPEDQGNGWGPWDPAKFTVEDSAFGFIVMENGATIILESSWALNTTLNREAVTSVCGTLGGGDMYDGVHINGVRNGRQYILEPNMNCGGAAFFDGQGDDPAHIREARNWLKAIAEDKDPVVLPEQAFCVTRILEGIYESAKTGKPFYFDN